MNHHLNTNIAVDYDVNIALFLDSVKFWTFNNLANKRNVHDGFCWTYNTLEAFQITFPFWTKRQLETIISNAVNAGLIMKGNYNKNRYDRTCWYALTYKAYDYFPELKALAFAETLYSSISPKCEMNFTEWGNLFLGIVTPIPDTKPDTKPYITTIGTSTEVPEGETNLPVPTPKPKKPRVISFGIEQLLEDNPHNIDKQQIEDWAQVRKSKRAPITKTTWNKINKTLTLIQSEANVSPADAFETMVASGWQSIELKYFLSRTAPLPKKSKTLAELTHGIDLNQVYFL